MIETPIAMNAHSVAEVLAATAAPWAKVYSHSKGLSAAVTFLHVAPLVFGAGAAFVMDRTTLRVSREGALERSRHLHELERVHRVVITGLTFSFVSGVLFFLADVATFLDSPLFWIKLSLVGLLLLNGLLLKGTEKALLTASNSDSLWHRMRTLSIVSAVLWLATTLAGVVLIQFA
jgi:uncharacterized membrane protein